MKNPFGTQPDPCIDELKQNFEHMEMLMGKLEKENDGGRPLNGKRFLTDSELSQHLKCSRRTLQEYRSAGVLPYYLISGKVLYEEAALQKMLERAYKAPFDAKKLI